MFAEFQNLHNKYYLSNEACNQDYSLCMTNENLVFNSVYCNKKRISLSCDLGRYQCGKAVHKIHSINESIRYHFTGCFAEYHRKTLEDYAKSSEDYRNSENYRRHHDWKRISAFNISFYLLEVKSTCSDAGCCNEYLTSNSLLLTPSEALGKAISFEDESSCGT